jgi:hypothetical protein
LDATKSEQGACWHQQLRQKIENWKRRIINIFMNVNIYECQWLHHSDSKHRQNILRPLFIHELLMSLMTEIYRLSVYACSAPPSPLKQNGAKKLTPSTSIDPPTSSMSL